MGTAVYMAPEQSLGKSAAIGPSTDVFALGVILVQMLSLRMLPDARAKRGVVGLGSDRSAPQHSPSSGHFIPPQLDSRIPQSA
jgi:serine/threonine protein kinase